MFNEVLPEVFFQEVDSYSLLVVFCKHSSAVPLDQAGFANGTVADDDNLKEKPKAC
jgi:hypothetical protein